MTGTSSRSLHLQVEVVHLILASSWGLPTAQAAVRTQETVSVREARSFRADVAEHFTDATPADHNEHAGDPNVRAITPVTSRSPITPREITNDVRGRTLPTSADSCSEFQSIWQHEGIG